MSRALRESMIEEQMETFEVKIVDSTAKMITALVVAPTLIDRITEVQHSDDKFAKIKEHVRVEPLKQELL